MIILYRRGKSIDNVSPEPWVTVATDSYTQPVAFMADIARVIASCEGSLEVAGQLIQQDHK